MGLTLPPVALAVKGEILKVYIRTVELLQPKPFLASLSRCQLRLGIDDVLKVIH